jgi:hypothetical protein
MAEFVRSSSTAPSPIRIDRPPANALPDRFRRAAGGAMVASTAIRAVIAWGGERICRRS